MTQDLQQQIEEIRRLARELSNDRAEVAQLRRQLELKLERVNEILSSERTQQAS